MRKRILFISILVVSLAVVVCLGPEYMMRLRTHTVQYSQLSDVPAHRVALIFGARVNKNGTLTPILQDRVLGGVALYKAGKVQKLLMSGDSGKYDYNEVAAMTRVAEAVGVPKEDIAIDYAGFSTYESCYRAKSVFNLTDAVLVTQSYHMPRALFTCRHLGVDAVGYALPDWTLYPNLRWAYTWRELLASTKALGELYITHSKPTFLGPLVPIQ